MLRVPTRVAPSPLHGLGVFAAERIPAGTLVWAFDPPVDQRLPAKVLDGAPERVRAFVEMYAFQEGEDLVLPGDDARFINHSYTPNLDSSGAVTVAARDIEAGEELTDDYATEAY